MQDDEAITATGHAVLHQQKGLEISNRELYQLKRAEGMLDLHMRLLELRQSFLTQMNTQAALVAGCAVGLLSSGELDIMNVHTVCNIEAMSWIVLAGCLPTEYITNFFYIVFAINSFLWALFTIFLSNHLVGMTMIVALHGSGLDDIKSIEPLLRRKMNLIENGFHVSLACLVGAVGCMIAEMNFFIASFLAAPFILAIGMLARWQTRDISRELEPLLLQLKPSEAATAEPNSAHSGEQTGVLPILGDYLRRVGEKVMRRLSGSFQPRSSDIM